MLQRIQTVYLLIIVALTTAMLFLPLANLQMDGAFYKLDVLGVSTLTSPSELVYPVWSLFALVAIIIVVALVSIFLYKKRMLQIRLCVFNALLMLGFYGLVAFLLWNMKSEIVDFAFNLKIALAFPIISLILDYLAIRNIGADEALVRSLNRLR
ncbi:MAG: DUF4293 domain-containing protein [Tannerellaceae bacterium]|nr:DUF4293 domain-containing protein [Tannerellaceae bacterium]MCD8263101.1 DUF4293 domain-containing protein [Tannerellaceae bacterium]